jgi:DNA-binding GntR family transcriptional regulator
VSATASRPIDSPSLVEVVRERLIEDIMERRYLPGQKLPVVEIAERYGVSETPVKLAFHRLVTEGMLEALPRRGVVVRRVSLQDVRELMEARHMVNLVSVDAAIRAAADRDTAVVERLRSNLKDHALLVAEVTGRLSIDAFLRYVRLDREYHRIYLQCARNRILERFFEQLSNQVTVFVSLSELMTARMRSACDEHGAILRACLAGQRDAMIDELIHHKETALRTVEAMFERDRS